MLQPKGPNRFSLRYWWWSPESSLGTCTSTTKDSTLDTEQTGWQQASTAETENVSEQKVSGCLDLISSLLLGS